MWKHEILENLSFDENGEFWGENGIEHADEFRNSITSSQVFYFGEKEKYKNIMPKLPRRVKDLTVQQIPKLPFDKVIYEYTNTSNIVYMDLAMLKYGVKQKNRSILRKNKRRNHKLRSALLFI